MQSGQLLFQIDPRQFQAPLDQAQGALGRPRRRWRRPSSTSPATRRSPAKARSASRSSTTPSSRTRPNKAAVDAAEAHGRAGRSSTSAGPRSTRRSTASPGIASAQIGDLVEPHDRADHRVAVDPIKVELPISEQEYLRFARAHQPRARLARPRERAELELILADGSVYPHAGHVLRRRPRGRPAHRHHARAGAVPEPGQRPAPGQYAKVRAAIDDREERAASSRSARCRICRARTRSRWSARTTRSRCATSSRAAHRQRLGHRQGARSRRARGRRGPAEGARRHEGDRQAVRRRATRRACAAAPA